MEYISLLWNEGIVKPMLNSLVLLYAFLGHNFGLSVIVFTVLIRLLTFPLTLRQLKQTRALQALQPKLKEAQQRYGKDRQRVSQETMRLYREHGVSPLGCLGPFVIQFPIWIGLYQSVIRALPSNPETIVELAKSLYPWLGVVHRVVPLQSDFLWLDLAVGDPTPILPILVGVSTWAMQKMSTPPTTDPRQSSTNTMMLWMMPLMLAFFTFSFPSGLALYWVVSNVVGMVMQYFVTGWGGLRFTRPWAPAKAPAAQAGEADVPQMAGKESSDDGHGGSDREDRRGGRRSRAPAARRRARGGGGRRPK